MVIFAALQATVHEVLKHGGLASLPEESQWQIRLLLPKQAEEIHNAVRDTVQAQQEAVQQSPQQDNASGEQAPAVSGEGRDVRMSLANAHYPFTSA